MSGQKASNLEYQKRLQKALTYIRENLSQSINIKDVARAACFSEFHFHRIFSSMMGEPLGEYITRKKLERAAIKLAYSPGASISDIAENYGYASVSSFSKAFKQWFGCRPTEIKKIRQSLDSGEGKLQTKYEKSIESDQLFVNLNLEQLPERRKEIDAHVRIETVDAFQVFYLTSSKGYEPAGIEDVWREMKERLEDINIDINNCQRFAISHDHPGLTPLSQCRYDACLKLPKDCRADLDLASTTIPSGRYAVYRVQGPADSILGQYLEFYTLWLPTSGYEPDDYPVLEHYPLPNCDQIITSELWAKVKRL